MLRAQHKDTLAALKSGKYTEAETSVLEKVAAEMIPNYSE
jgi:hypothetical protein